MAGEKRRLIDANELMSDVYRADEQQKNDIWHTSDIEYLLEAQPTVQAVEVVHGRWKYYHKNNIAVCTNCSFERNLDADFGRAVSCPNCGAKMDGGNDDAER